MKNILIITPAMDKGGMERQLSIFFNEFDRSKYQVSLAVLINRIQYQIPADVQLIDLKKERKLDIKFYYRLIRLVISGRYDLINTKLSGINEMLMIICGIFRRKELIVEIRSSGNRMLPFYKKMKWLYQIFRINWPVICNSQKAAEEIKKFIPGRVPVHVVRNGIDTSYFVPPTTHAARNQVLELGFVGSFKPVKNIELLLKAVHLLNSRHHKCTLTIVGMMQEKVKGHQQVLLDLEQELKVTSFVNWAGVTNDIKTYYDKFDVFILPSFEEGTPNVLLEAMSCGCFCLVSKQANSDQYISEEFTFDAYEPQTLVDKLIWYQQLSEASISASRVKNRKFVEQRYSITQMVDSMSQIYSTSY
jgi:glycosyltransferase involved in cell wall biosynthesis